MYSDHGDRRSRRPGSPIRASPDHRLCASPRSFSQLTTPFFAYLRLGIPTHALSSLTIKSISDTEHSRSYLPISTLTALLPAADQSGRTYVCPSRIQFSKIEKTCWRSRDQPRVYSGIWLEGPAPGRAKRSTS